MAPMNPVKDERRQANPESGPSMAERAKEAAQDLATTAKKKAASATHSVGAGMESLADTIREKGPHEGTLGRASSRIASSLESGGHYLQEASLSSMAEDVTNVVRRNPIAAILVGVGIGYLLARATRR